MLSRLAHARADFVGALRTDALASVVVFLVALPLCMGVAIASGAPPAAGLITGIVGGLVVGVLAGSPLQVSGPAAGLAVVLWELLQRHGATGLGVIVLLAGLMQLTAGAPSPIRPWRPHPRTPPSARPSGCSAARSAWWRSWASGRPHAGSFR